MEKQFMSIRAPLISVLVLIASTPATSGDELKGATVELSGRMANAVHIGADDFQKSEKWKPECFDVVIGLLGNDFEISFVPKQPASEPFRDGAPFFLGGATTCGPLVTYVIDLEGKIVSKNYSR